MIISRLVAAALTAVCLVAPVAHAQESPSASTPVDPTTSVSGPDSSTPDSPTDASAGPGKVIQAVVTGYASSGTIGSLTASGVATHWGTVAADIRLYPMGTRLQIEGFPNVVFVVEDTGAGIHGNIFDVWFPDLPSAVAFGTRSLKVTLLAGADH